MRGHNGHTELRTHIDFVERDDVALGAEDARAVVHRNRGDAHQRRRVRRGRPRAGTAGEQDERRRAGQGAGGGNMMNGVMD